MEAAKSNILLRGYFNKKKKAEARKQSALKKETDLQKKNNLKTAPDSTKKVADAPSPKLAKDSLQ